MDVSNENYSKEKAKEPLLKINIIIYYLYMYVLAVLGFCLGFLIPPAIIFSLILILVFLIPSATLLRQGKKRARGFAVIVYLISLAFALYYCINNFHFTTLLLAVFFAGEAIFFIFSKGAKEYFVNQ